MKFTAEKSQIVDSLQNAAAVAERRQTIPILANLRLKASSGKLEVTATDLEIQIKNYSDLLSIEEEGETTVSARKMSELCRSLPDAENVDFLLKDGKLTVSSENFHGDFATISADDFPELEVNEEQESTEVQSAVLKRILTKTAFSMASQDVRYYLNGLLLELTEGEIKAVATDGHRLAMSELAVKGMENERQLILPRKGVIELSRLLSEGSRDISMSLGQNQIRASMPEYTFTSKLVDGNFPDYRRVLPKGGNKVVLGNRQELKNAFSRVSILSNEKYRGVRLVLSPGELKVLANNPEQEEAEEAIQVNYDGEPLEIGNNPKTILILTVI